MSEHRGFSIEPLLTPADLQKILRVNRRTVQRMRASGRLPAPDLIIGQCPRWRPEVIREWLASGGVK